MKDKFIYEGDLPGLIRGRVKVQWVNLGEGFDGDYNPDNWEDENFLRFDVSVKVRGKWDDQLQDASYCTGMPARAKPEILKEALRVIMRECHSAVINRNHKRILERLSWIGLEDFTTTMTAKQYAAEFKQRNQ